MYISGETRLDIRKALCVTENVLNGWIQRGGWGRERSEIKKRAILSIYLETFKKVEENTRLHIDISRTAGTITGKEIKKIFQNQKQTGEADIERVAALVKIAKDTASIQRISLPIANEDIVKALLEQAEDGEDENTEHDDS